MNMRLRKRKTKLYTWRGPGHWNRYQIIYILAKQRFRNSIRDVKTLPGGDFRFKKTFFKKCKKKKAKSNLKKWEEETKMEFGKKNQL